MCVVLELTKGVTVKAGQAKTSQLFSCYFEKNWKPDYEMWTAPSRRKLPLMGINDTQGCERQNLMLKQSIELRFNCIPPMAQLVVALPDILNDTIYRHQKLYSRRVVYRHTEPCLNEALEDASFILNRTGEYCIVIKV